MTGPTTPAGPDSGTDRGTLHTLAVHLVRALAPLDDAFRDPESFARLMLQLGWRVDGLPPAYVTIADQVLAASDALMALSDDPGVDDVLAVISKVGDVYRSVASLPAAPPGVDPAAFLPEIGRRLFEFLLAHALRVEAPRWFATLHSLGVIAFEDAPPVAGRPGFTRLRFDWDQLPAVLSDPGLVPARLYGWGTPDFAFAKLATLVAPLLHAAGVPVSIERVDPDLGKAIQSTATGKPAGPLRHAIAMPLFDLPIDGTYQQFGFLLAGLPAEGDARPGLILAILAPTKLTETVDLGDGWTFTLRAGTDLAEQLAVVVRPGETSVRYPFAPGHPLPSAGLGLTLAHKSDPPTVLFGQPGGTRLELASAALDLAVDEKAGEIEVSAGVTVDGLTFVLHTDDLDSFLGSVLGAQDVKVPLQLGVAWSSRTGLSFVAGAGLAVSLHPHLDLGLLRFDRVDLAVRLAVTPGPPELDVRALVSFSGAIGPVSYAVDQAGAQLAARFAEGNAGPFSLDLSPVWPTGLGLGIDAGPVRGGGFVSYDRDKGRYIGILQLEIFEIGVTAIGVLDTRDASGADLPPPGYSFVLLVSARIPPIQLGYGFTLNGGGGVAALNRRLDTAALQAGIRQGGVQKILFPVDPVRDANEIVASLGAIFPIAMGRYVFGPTAIIGWGTPTLITIELAIVVEVPAPVTLALLGQASVVLPDADAPVVELHVDIAGVYDSARKTIAVDTSLHDSHVAGFSLAGDTALRLSWGDQPVFALAVGGFHPAFTPPPGFPTLRRVTLALGLDDNPRISLEGYLAVTPNSRQVGAKAELYAAAGGFNVHGWLSFDALLTLHPFSFRFDFSVGMTLNHGKSRIAGITVSGKLTGPDPFHVHGKGSLSLLFFDISVPFDASFGLSLPAAVLGPADPWPVLAAALALLDNWSGESAPRRSVALVASAAGGGPMLDPGGSATLRQKVLPLARPLQAFGEYAVAGPDTFTVAQVALGGRPAAFAAVTDMFAPGDFEKLSATDQLSRASFEPMQSGIRAGDSTSAPVDRTKVASLAYQTKIIDSSWRTREVPTPPLGRASQLAAALSGSVVRGTAAGRSRFARLDGRAGGVVVEPAAYTVASTGDLATRPDIVAAATQGAARAALRASGAAGLQVVPRYETEHTG